MAELNNIYENLKLIRECIKDRYCEVEVKKRKILEAKSFYTNFNKIIKQITSLEIDDNKLAKIKDISSKIKIVYQEILNSTETEVKTPLLTTQFQIPYQEGTMSNFDLKTAISLLPVLNGKEETVQSLIDAIELYDSMLNDEGKKLLIKFVIKTRLTASAKLRLAAEYVTIPQLVTDMRKYLLTRKSETALQLQLNRTIQADKTIADFGKELEELFVNLTISQADGNDNAFKVLKPINERLAIKRFADGLRNHKLSTIIASRNYSELKDAVQAAQDEEISRPSKPEVMMISKHNSGYRGNFNSNRSARGYFKPGNKNFYRGSNRTNNFGNNYRHNNRGNQNQNFRNSRGSRPRGRYMGRSNAFYAETVETNKNETEQLNYFFRENDE